jgi:hypothetical protein
MKTIKIFLASSDSLVEYRKLFEIDINRINIDWVKKDMFLELIIWENFSEYMVKEGKQKEYDEAVATCDIFVIIYSDLVGIYSMEEFDCAVKSFNDTGLPTIFTYHIESANEKKNTRSIKEFLAKLSEHNHYESKNISFDQVRSKFKDELIALTGEDPHFKFPDNTPRITEKVLYIKMIHLMDQSKNGKPVYLKYIERLQAEESVFDEAQFFETLVYSSVAPSTKVNNYTLSKDGTLDMNIIIPKQGIEKPSSQLEDDEKISNRISRDVALNSNIFYSVTSFINSFQKNKTFYQTRADEFIKQLRLIIDFSSLSNCADIQLSSPVGKRYSTNKQADTAILSVKEIKRFVYQVDAIEIEKGEVLAIYFDIDWDKVPG